MGRDRALAVLQIAHALARVMDTICAKDAIQIAAQLAPGRVFVVGDELFRIEDVVLSAVLRGELAPDWTQHQHRLACAEQALLSGRTVDAQAVQELCDEFRYQLDLITVEETAAWLTSRGLSESDLIRHLQQKYWCTELGRCVPRPDRPLLSSTAEEMTTFATYLLLEGTFDVVSRRLAHRVAFTATCLDTDRPLVSATQSVTDLGNSPAVGDPDRAREWLEQLGRDPDWMSELAVREAAFRSFCQESVAEDKLARLLARSRLSLVSLDYEMIEVDSPEVMREAKLSLTVDGLSPQQLSEEFGFPYHRARILLERLPDPLRQPLLSAAPGEVVTREGDRYQLFVVLAKREPTLSDASIRDLLHERLLQQALVKLEAERVHWFLRPPSGS